MAPGAHRDGVGRQVPRRDLRSNQGSREEWGHELGRDRSSRGRRLAGWLGLAPWSWTDPRSGNSAGVRSPDQGLGGERCGLSRTLGSVIEVRTNLLAANCRTTDLTPTRGISSKVTLALHRTGLPS